jgi:hypothetical protein
METGTSLLSNWFSSYSIVIHLIAPFVSPALDARQGRVLRRPYCDFPIVTSRRSPSDPPEVPLAVIPFSWMNSHGGQALLLSPTLRSVISLEPIKATSYRSSPSDNTIPFLSRKAPTSSLSCPRQKVEQTLIAPRKCRPARGTTTQMSRWAFQTLNTLRKSAGCLIL